MPERVAIFALAAVFAIPGGITFAKGQKVAFWVGFLSLGLVWLAAACRLARPTSAWAVLFYGPEKMLALSVDVRLSTDPPGATSQQGRTLARAGWLSRRAGPGLLQRLLSCGRYSASFSAIAPA